ncbi:unnamed protein product, partial [Prorocentrum cordatum]
AARIAAVAFIDADGEHLDFNMGDDRTTRFVNGEALNPDVTELHIDYVKRTCTFD